MNSLVFKLCMISGLITVLASCKKEEDLIYELEPVRVAQSGTGKSQLKTTDQFVTIAWQDLFGSNIPQYEMSKLNVVYTAFGDKKVVEDIIIRNFLNKPGLVIPSSPAINGDTLEFIKATYMKFYNREPGVFESFYLREQFRLNPALKPEGLYYALMTSDEYRFY